MPKHDRTAPTSRAVTVALWLIVGVCCGLPLIWICLQIARHPKAMVEIRQDLFRLHLLQRTLVFNGASALIATMMAVPAGVALGRGRGIFARLIWIVMPISLLLPSIAFAYGWKQFFRLAGFDFVPAGKADIARCVWTLATWLWPLPAGLIGLALRRLDTHVQEQAMLDGALWRTTFRQLAAPIIAGLCLVTVLAVQEFAVYEPTGISVVATEMRMVFDTGAYSSTSNPITQQMGFGPGRAMPTTQAHGSLSVGFSPDQSARAVAAVATSIPLLGVILVLSIVALVGARKLSTSEAIEVGAWSPALDAPWWTVALSWLLVLMTIIVPIASMKLSLSRPFNLASVFNEFRPQITGSIIIAIVTGAMAILLAFLASATIARGAMLIGAITFLIGGPLLAIVMICIYNRPWLAWVYDGLPIIVMVYVARFGWIALMSGRSTWGRAWKQVRELSAIDGASPLRSAISTIAPIAWPILTAAGVLVMILSLSEAPATVLISPQNPQPLIPMMMTWVHMQRYDAMIEASLVMCAIVTLLGVGAVFLTSIGMRAMRALTAGQIAAPPRVYTTCP
jgi:ABC-type Fe3+ transport system permease subunit